MPTPGYGLPVVRRSSGGFPLRVMPLMTAESVLQLLFFFLIVVLFLIPPPCLVDAQPWTHSTSNLTVSRAYLSAVAVGGMAIFAGGNDVVVGYATATAAVDVYHAHNDSWTTAALSQARASMAATTVGSLALFAGGELPGGFCSDVVDIYNTANNSWTTATLSVPRCSLAATSVGDLAIFAGGVSSGGSSADTVDVYNAANDSWSTMQPLSAARGFMGATSVRDLAIFAFGFGPRVDMYNATSNEWTHTDLGWGRGRVAATTVGERAFFISGDAYYTIWVDAYNVVDHTWTVVSNFTRIGASATAVGDVVVVAGGYEVDDPNESPTARVSFLLGNMSLVDGPSLTVARRKTAMTTIGNKVMIAGGFMSSFDCTSSVEIFTFAFDFVELTPSPTPSQTPSSSPTPSITPSMTPSASITPSQTPSSSPTPSMSPTASPSWTPSPRSPSPSPIHVMPELRINNATGLDVLLTPKDGRNGVQEDMTIGISFAGTIKELDHAGALVQEGSPTVSGAWRRVNDSSLGASQSYLFSATIAINGTSTEDGKEASSSAEMEVQFFLFENPTTIPLDGGNGTTTSLSIEPSLAKFTLRLRRWPWQREDNTLEMRIKITPPFTNFSLTSRDESSGLSSFMLINQFGNDDRAYGAIRLVDLIVLDGETQAQGQGVRFNLDAKRSELVLWFGHFNESLVYDPDMGVLFSSGRGSNDSPPVGLIVGVAVGGAAALAFVLVVMGATVVGVRVRARRRARMEAAHRSKVNFSYDDFAGMVDEEGIELEPRRSKRNRSLAASSPLASVYS